MVETKFTKGPWKAVPDTMTRIPDKIYRVIGPSEIVCGDDGICCHDHYNDRYYEEDKANMHLIATAPEMYEGIEAAIDELKALELITSLDGFSYTTTPIVIKQLETILAKARGDSK